MIELLLLLALIVVGVLVYRLILVVDRYTASIDSYQSQYSRLYQKANERINEHISSRMHR